jgi:FRG domain
MAPEMLKVEAYLLDQFRAVAPTHLPTATFVATTPAAIDWWPIIRHYGVPTRILDWTFSIYVAAYFAVSRLTKCDGAIYALHRRTLDEAMSAVHGKEAAHFPKVDDPSFRDPDTPHAVNLFGRKTAVPERISVQQGGFMVCRNVAGDLENILATEVLKAGDPIERLIKLRIPAPSKPRFMTHLRAMNVTARSLFPGLDGIGRHLDETIRYR